MAARAGCFGGSVVEIGAMVLRGQTLNPSRSLSRMTAPHPTNNWKPARFGVQSLTHSRTVCYRPSRKQARQSFTFFERVLINQADLLARVNALRDQTAQGVLIPVLPDDCPTLPASSPAEMKALNTYLKKKEKLNQMATYFRQSGGKDHKAAARTVLGLLISNSVAKCCSWAGSHGAKEALLDYGNILELVLAALKPKFDMADRSTVADVAKRWLSSSSDRDGGRTNRRHPNKS
ncbi:unnamed protein product [Ixodes persulcatus]